jgi:rhamnogalacturonyl hydrolase YesR
MKRMGVIKMIIGGIVEAGRISLADALGTGKSLTQENGAHIEAALGWIARAQDATPDGGVSWGYSVLTKKWAASYPETTGYIIPTMFACFHATGDDEYKKRALRMADWEISVQMRSGASQSGSLDTVPRKPAIFNTGQLIFGLAEAYKETKNRKYKKAAEKAANWLIKSQDDDGAWRKNLSILTTNPVHVYNTRTAWALLQAHDIMSKKIYLNAAVKNIDWALTQQLDNGWFENAAFNINDYPLLHTIAYTIRGILECGIYLNNKAYLDAARESADALLQLQQKDGSLYGIYNSKWENTVSWSCLVGDAQTSVIWLRLFEITHDKRYFEAARNMNQYLKSTQDLKSANGGIRGGIKGSQPFYGGYASFDYPNCAAKFFVDALLLENKLQRHTRAEED